ncbi:MAG: type VII secretion-associated serine protease mycosin [Actinobacteria bacterium 13_2_20CM_2_71_6]|nr:MAG: type VII secretion-associated serine protease mycosin [Actinobacteria bacterium 13_2_20CM_2_71_6]
MRGIRAAGAVALLATFGLVPAMPARAEVTCAPPPAPGQQIPGVPWPQARYDPKQLAGIADGSGVTVAVVDSGVDATHPQLTGAVLRGEDLLSPGGTGQRDCVGHGTAVASIIAAAPLPGVDFAGLAPKARVMPFRVTEREMVDGRPQGRDGPPDGLARAIRDAADRAQVINLSLAQDTDEPKLRAAVEYALARDVVVVAAVGNQHQGTGTDGPAYPAAYPGVLGVGAIDENGSRLAQSQVGRYVSVVAPGGNVVAAAPGQGLARYDGTSFAAPFVSATAALIRQYRPGLHANEIVARILATTDPAPAGKPDGGYGYGILNPYRAVTEQLGPARSAGAAPAPVPAAAVARPMPTPTSRRPRHRRRDRGRDGTPAVPATAVPCPPL